MVNKKIVYILLLSTILIGQNSKLSITKSLVLPGWGQLSENNNKSAKQFFVQEGILWLSLIGTIWTSNHFDQAYVVFAKQHAGIDLSNMSLQMAVDIGNYSNWSEYNENKKRMRKFSLVLDENNSKNYWEWDSDDNRNQFEKMRITSGLSKKVGNFIIGGLIGHRIISAIHIKYLQNIKMPKVRLNISSISNKKVTLIWNL